eukprot:Colp12_sorted_trinity150504_noHs@3909
MKMKSLLVYYGWPSCLNGLDGRMDKLVEAYSKYEYIIFGAGLEEESHGDHKNTKTIISKLSDAVFVFGYIDLGVSTYNYTMPEIRRRIKAWKQMGVQGIFFDDFGFDFDVNRDRQNEAIAAVHAEGLKVCANAWNSADVFVTSTDLKSNPSATRINLKPGDFYLVESYVIIEGSIADDKIWRKRMQDIKEQQVANGFEDVRLLGVTTASPSSVYDQKLFEYVCACGYVDNLEAVGYGEHNFGSENSKAPYRARLELPSQVEKGPPSPDMSQRRKSGLISPRTVYTREITPGYTIQVEPKKLEFKLKITS